MSILSGLMDLIFPPKCMFCKKVLPAGTQGCCAACAKGVVQKELPIEGTFFDRCYFPMHYDGAVQDAIVRFKFQDQPGYATEFGRILAECIRENLKGTYDLITWVPVSEERRKKRGYDQAMLLAMAAALELDDVAVETLVKMKDNPSQSSLENAEQRRGNVLGTYAPADAELIAGKRILLVDDIITTGATMDEAARTLKQAGAERVLCVALAHPMN